MTECNICGNETDEKNPVRVGFETRFLCDECLNKIRKRYYEVKNNENNNSRDAD